MVRNGAKQSLEATLDTSYQKEHNDLLQFFSWLQSREK